MENKINQKDGEIFGLCLRTEKDVEYESDSDWNNPKRLGKKIGGFGN